MSEQWIKCYQQHLERYLESAIRSQTFQQEAGTSTIEILMYDQLFTGCRTFCSLGLTHYRQEVENIAEVILATDDGWDDIPYIFANALFYIVQAKMKIGWGMVIGGIDTIAPHFARKFGKMAL